MNEPLDADAVDATPTTLTIVWQDTLQIEWGFEISYRVVNGPPDNRTVVAIPSENTEQFVLSGLVPDTEYCVHVWAVSHYRRSDSIGVYTDGVCTASTLPEPDAEPTEETATVWLQREEPFVGNIYYTAVFPAFGNILNGILQEMRSGGVFLQFVNRNFQQLIVATPTQWSSWRWEGAWILKRSRRFTRIQRQPAGAFRGLLRACDWYRSHYDRHEHHLFQDGLAGEPRALGTRIAMRGGRLTSSAGPPLEDSSVTTATPNTVAPRILSHDPRADSGTTTTIRSRAGATSSPLPGEW